MPCDSDVEPLATKEQTAAFKDDQRRESELERELNSRLAKEKTQNRGKATFSLYAVAFCVSKVTCFISLGAFVTNACWKTL